MSRPLQPVTEAGRQAAGLAERLAEQFGPGAAQWDRAGIFPCGHLTALQAAGLAAASVPPELGGGGVDQLRDLAAVAARMAYGDSSMGIVLNMHLSFCWSLARAARAGVPGVEGLLRRVADGTAWFCAGVTERATNYFNPRTTLTDLGAEGWLVDGHKVFASGSPVASHIHVSGRIVGGAHDGWQGSLIVPTDSAGVEVVEDWDGLGMRASGSGQVWLRQVHLGPETVFLLGGGRVGAFNPGAVQGRVFGNVGNVAAMVGIAEAARDHAVARIRAEGRISIEPLASRATVRHALAEVDIALATARAMVAAVAAEADEVAARPSLDRDIAFGLMASFQEAKVVTNRCVASALDGALTLCGGAAYEATHPIARRVRDVRAGLFMQPFSPHEALGFIGAVAAGTEPDPEA